MWGSAGGASVGILLALVHAILYCAAAVNGAAVPGKGGDS